MASRLVERTGRPVIVVTIDEQDVYKRQPLDRAALRELTQAIAEQATEEREYNAQMCIRDRETTTEKTTVSGWRGQLDRLWKWVSQKAVSYTHLPKRRRRRAAAARRRGSCGRRAAPARR